MKSVSIVIPNWNGCDLLAEYLPTVIAAGEKYSADSHAAVEINIIDDASTDASVEWLKTNYGDHKLVRIIELSQNVGFLRAVNKGFEESKNKIVFLLNNDVGVEQDCLDLLLRHFGDPDVFAVSCRAQRANSQRLDGAGKLGKFKQGFWRVFVNYEVIPEEASKDLISFYGSGGYSAYDHDKWDQMGGFQECLAPNYWEDVEICYRAWKRGWRVLYEPNSRVVHKGSATMSKMAQRERMCIITERNRLLMTWINLHDPRMFAAHVLWLALDYIGYAVSLKWNYLRSFGLALQKLGEVREQRRIEKRAATISDRDLASKFKQIVNETGIYVVANEKAEVAFAAKLEISRSSESNPGRI